MTSPLPFEIITPEGQAAYFDPYLGTYRTDISRAYAQRLGRGYARGEARQFARGQRPSGPQAQTEYQRRKQFRERYGSRAQFEATYGFSYNYWLKLRRRYIDRINELARDHATTDGLPFGPEFIAAELQNAGLLNTLLTGEVGGKPWIENRLAGKLYAMEQYRQGNPDAGAVMFATKDNLRAVEWWWYH